MKIVCKTGEITFSLKKYYETVHWYKLKNKYIDSDLSKLCYKCKKSNVPYNFIHRTKIRLGNERLTDIIPVCKNCFLEDCKPQKSKKKVERRQLAPLGFNPYNLSDKDKKWMTNIKPHLRGILLSKYFSSKAKKYKPSKQWINQQVKKSCKWIKKNKKQIEKLIDKSV